MTETNFMFLSIIISRSGNTVLERNCIHSAYWHILKEGDVNTVKEQDIATIIRSKRRYEAELLILQDCIDTLHDTDDTSTILHYTLTKRRLALIDHWLHLLPTEEKQMLQDHLVEGKSWKALAEQSSNDPTREMPCDARSLQRMQAKSLKRLETFVQKAFGNALDYLIDEEERGEALI